MLPQSLVDNCLSSTVSTISLPLLRYFLLLLLLSPSIRALSSNELCSNNVCSGCLAGSLSCQLGGLSRLPDRLSPDIHSMILIGHRFDSQHLVPSNFTRFGQPKNTHLKRLTLRNCAISRVAPRTFHSLQGLIRLDLSKNQLKTIEPETFYGLQLDLLRLDDNKNLELAPNAFKYTSIVSLSLNQCGLTSLPLEILSPLFGRLSNLQLTGNQLHSLDSRYAPAFLALKSLSLEQNPFNCDCRLAWLADVLQSRHGSDSHSNLLQQDDPLAGEGSSVTSGPLDGDVAKAACRSPENLSGRPIELLTRSNFYCTTPSLNLIEVDLDKSSQQPDRLSVTLRCRVKGSPDLDVGWYRRPTRALAELASDFGAHSASLGWPPLMTKLVQSPSSNSNMAQVTLTQPLNGESSMESLQDRLVCFGHDSTGNASADVALVWPIKTPLGVAIINESTKPVTAPMGSNIVGGKKTDRSDDDDIIDPDWYLMTQREASASIWFQKQFSVLDMIGAVVGTFAMTLILFMMVWCFIRFHRRYSAEMRPKILLQQTSSIESSSNQHFNVGHQPQPQLFHSAVGAVKYPPPPATPSTAFYSTVPTPQYTNGTLSKHTLTPVSRVADPSSGSDVTSPNQGQQYPVYDIDPGQAVSGNASCYNDSQTYDMPQLHQQPLPPLPAQPIHHQLMPSPLMMGNNCPSTPSMLINTTGHHLPQPPLQHQLAPTSTNPSLMMGVGQWAVNPINGGPTHQTLAINGIGHHQPSAPQIAR